MTEQPYIRKAKMMARHRINDSFSMTNIWVSIDELEVSWCVWTTKGWTVLVSAPRLPGKTFRVTYSSKTKETTITSFVTIDKIVISDRPKSKELNRG